MFSDFVHSAYYSLLIAAAVVSLLLMKRFSEGFTYLAILIIVTLISESIAKYVSFVYRKNSNFIYHVFVVIEFGFYALIYSRFFGNRQWNIILLFCFAALFLAEILNTIFLQPLKWSNTNVLILEALMLVFISLNYFMKLREETLHTPLVKEPIFWFNCAVLFYYSFNVLIWGFHSLKVYQLKKPPLIIYDFNLILSALLYFVYGSALILNSFSNYKTVPVDE